MKVSLLREHHGCRAGAASKHIKRMMAAAGEHMSLDETWISTQAAAELADYHVNYIRRLIREGEIEGRKWGSAWMVSKPSLLKYLEKVEKLGGKRGPKRETDV